MKTLLSFEMKSYFGRIGFYFVLLFIFFLGIFAGTNFNMSFGPDIFKNSPYTIAYMVGFLSLLCIFFTTIFATQILFKERDARFELILFATPIQKGDFVLSRFVAIFLLSFLCFAVLIAGFAMGQKMAGGAGNYTQFSAQSYIIPLLFFGLVNSFSCTSILCFSAWLMRNKLLVYVTGLFLYVAYIVALIFSGSPMMAQSMPQSAQALLLSASLDPFGLSAFFLQTSTWSLLQRNTEMVSLTGIFLFNRVGVTLLSGLLLFVSYRNFSFTQLQKAKNKSNSYKQEPNQPHAELFPVQPSHGINAQLLATLSFARIDLKYIVRSIPFLLTAIALLFDVAMEIYGMIEKGIRIPQKYASSGLMAETIIENFHILCLMVVLYYGNEIFWRSKNSHFDLIEKVTPTNTATWFFSKWLTLSTLVIIFSSLMIAEGIAFQWLYGYLYIDWNAYIGVYLFNAFPLIISCGLILIIQKLLNRQYIGLGLSILLMLVSATSLGKKLLPHPLLRFQSSSNGVYSDLNGFGSYLTAFGWRYLFGICAVLLIAILVTQAKSFRLRWQLLVIISMLMLVAVFSAFKATSGYQSKAKDVSLQAQADYEKKYRYFQNLAMPAITDVVTTVDLFPERNAYIVSGSYLLRNKTAESIDSILINFADGIEIVSAELVNGEDTIRLTDRYGIAVLKKPLLPNASAKFSFKFSYQWFAVNGHESFNAIIENGSFMRISRYFPLFGYLSDNEIEDDHDRMKLGLGKATPVTVIEAPGKSVDDFINLEMTISTAGKQTAIGVGELVQKWNDKDRNYFRYKTTSPIPFRFAISSAIYEVKKEKYKGRGIEIYYHHSHDENIQRLLSNIKLTLDYCEKNFGNYPFETLRFAEVSSFTRGFAATAYPGTIYMTENMVFHANVEIDEKKDVINELAGHELSHIWWGNSQISPDNREGAAMLTETLAMYTELMLMRQRYGKEIALERVRMHLGIYLDERGFNGEQPLCRVSNGNAAVSYSKGVVVMFQLSELIGEERVNEAMRNFLRRHAYPAPKPVSTDFISELYAVTDTSFHSRIADLFERITLYGFKLNGSSVRKPESKFELKIDGIADKYYEDGRGGRTKTVFNDTVEVSILLKSGKDVLRNVPVVNNRFTTAIQLDDEPVSLLMDPGVRFIKPDEMKRIKIGN